MIRAGRWKGWDGALVLVHEPTRVSVLQHPLGHSPGSRSQRWVVWVQAQLPRTRQRRWVPTAHQRALGMDKCWLPALGSDR